MVEKKEKPVVEEEVSSTETVEQTPNENWGGKLLWGMLFIVAGIIMLLDSYGVISVDLSQLWKLWPVLIVLAGVSILTLRGWVAVVVYSALALLILAIAWMTMTGTMMMNDEYYGRTTSRLSVTQQSSSVKTLDLTIRGGAGTYTIRSGGGDELIKGELIGRSAQFDHKSVIEGNKQIVTITSKSDWQWHMGAEPEQMDLTINTKLPTSLLIDAGASKIEADLSGITVESLTIDTGASSVDVKLGKLAKQADVKVDTGASSVNFQVPESVGVKLRIDSGLSSKNIPSSYKQIDDKTYQSPDYDSASNKIDITIDMGVSSFGLSEY